MNTFETLSRDAVEPVEPKREAETSPDAARRIRAELDGLLAELAEAKETVAYLEARENELVAEKAELARSLAESEKTVDALNLALGATSEECLELFRKFRDAQDDAALNNVATWRRAAFGFGVSSALAVGILLLMIGL